MTVEDSQEDARIRSLNSYEILDTLPEAIFDDITLLASQICQTPIALMSFVDKDRQWFKSRIGVEAHETARNLAFCNYTIQQEDIFVVNHADTTPGFSDNVLVTGEMGIRFYAGAVLKTTSGEALGSLCVIDNKPRELDENQLSALRALARQMMQLLNFRKLQIEQAEARAIEQALRVELEKAKVLAETANEAKTSFLANMSHEIRSPLGAIKGFIGLLKDGDMNSRDADNYLNIIEKNSVQVLDIIDDILDLSKVEAGMMSVENIEVSLPELLADFSALMNFRAKENGIDFALDAETALPNAILTDPTRLRQILTNIVGNAIKFTSSGQVTVSVSYANSLLRFRIQDSGIGISLEQASRLFNPFHQADISTSRKFGGTGLGLALTRRLAEAMGGKFWLESSEIGKGSLFIAEVACETLPHARYLKAGIFTFGTVKKPSPTKNDPSIAGKNILIVDDSPDNQLLLAVILKRSGATTATASDGAEGVELALSGTYDLVLMDVQMPTMDGYRAVGILREKNYQVPIIALTAHAMSTEKERCLQAGFSDFLSKPINRVELMAMMKSHLGS